MTEFRARIILLIVLALCGCAKKEDQLKYSQSELKFFLHNAYLIGRYYEVINCINHKNLTFDDWYENVFGDEKKSG